MKPSIGFRWTVRSMTAMMIAVLAMAFFAYRRMAEEVRRGALVVAELQVNELYEAIEHQATAGALTPELIAYIDQHVESASEDVKLGIRVVDFDENPLLERGIFLHREFPERPDLPGRAAHESAVEVPVGDSLPYLVYARPLPFGFVEVAVSTRPFVRGLLDLRDGFLEMLPVALLLTGALSYWLTRRSLAPIAEMTATARRITTSQLDARVPRSESGDELDSLAATLNAMIGRIQDGVDRIRGFSSTAAHQLRTPLALLQTRLEIAALAERDANADRTLILAALRDVERLGAAVGGMLRLADSEAGLHPEKRELVDLEPAIAQVVEFFEPVATKKHVTLEFSSETNTRVDGDPDWLRELFSNLVDNALKYTPSGGSVRVTTERAGSVVRVLVRDDGAGIEPDRLESVFERFERGSSREATGAGLGLTIAREIAHAHDGAISVASKPGLGSTFTVSLPVALA